MTFYVERYDGARWTCLMMAQHYINPSAIQGPPEIDTDGKGSYPPARTPGNASAFAGKPGWNARVRFDDQVMELYDWDKVPENPADENSQTLWGWKLRQRFAVAIPVDRIAVGELSVM